MISTIIDYLRLRKFGFSPANAWRYCYKPRYKIEIFIFLVLILSFFYALANNALADNEFNASELKWRAVEAKINAKQYQHINLNLENVLIACLRGESILIDGIDKPCKIGEYKNGKEIF